MRIVFFCLSCIITVAMVIVLGTNTLLPLPLGSFLSPQHGIWQNAEPVKQHFNARLHFSELKGKSTVYLDDRLVPHIVADNDEDACFLQGYLHARFRLWQMEFQTYAAAGRISEIVGDKALDFDKGRRRLGMVYAAENMLKEIEVNPLSKAQVDSYTAGVNAYITSLPESRLPVEYKLLGYKPEKWSNLKTALFVKQMAQTLSGFSDDLPLTKAKAFFGDEALRILFPQVSDSLDPVIPKGTLFPPASVTPVAPALTDSVYINNITGNLQEIEKPNPNNGSNNWAVSGARTRSGAPILCNDPHLDLSFPSIWYEMQVTTPTMNAYGVSFPGAPGVIIGFNDSIAFGFTNSERDVMDYYAIQFKDKTKTQYRFGSGWENSRLRIETIKVKGRPIVYDTIAYTVFGPVIYDESFPSATEPGAALALRWKAHDPSNELLTWYYLNRANNYEDYKNALQYFTNPAHNVVFASKAGDIAIWQQGVFPALWNRQGLYVMPGKDSSYMWQEFIPADENPHILNPERGFVSSANQRPADSTYPYFIPGYYDLYRGIAINRELYAIDDVTADDMMKLQNDNYNVFAETARPLLLKYVNDSSLNENERKYLDIVSGWSLYNNINERGATIFKLWYDNLEKQVWDDEFEKAGVTGLRPSEKTLTEALLRDTAFKYIDNINTPEQETITDVITNAYKQAAKAADSLSAVNQLTWGANKNTSIYHLLGAAMMPFARTGLPVGGGSHIINAMQHNHGPSWRMVIELTKETDAYVIYPGGQSGNPGSLYYDSFVDKWAAGEYYKAWFMKRGEQEGDRLVWKMEFGNE
ncbi:penicillin acylase family protein [Agriterribacter sp.]|uniref:penicillin acylase family protein n=1 Tax=Agriterribacter sp. TaxID=2821509 RepID=UPI002D0DBA0C|nr:penicillin acylase family protein [Agriterribacter sp.]HRO45068.1 penicillin acylase family protein [Agriterribacter sp.]HRQ15491.1 penicillin acylase family protein [Agriterribacter sp.]